jgi:thiol:disulfide interchange protein/DsbC/DsbD-like thiol-disulfide interchange protein
VVQTEQVRAELVAHAPQGVQPGQPVWVGLQFQHQPHWHTYWKNPGDSGLATQVQLTLPAGMTAGDIAWPTPTKIAIGSLANLGFEGTVLLPVPLTIAKDFQPSLAGDLEIRLAASWLVCKETCIPQEGNFVLRLPVQGSTALHGGAFDAARAAQPQAFAGNTQAQVNAQAVTVTVRGLPAAWQGKALNLYPETPELLETAATPGASDRLGAASNQRWKDGVWSASMPLSAQRSSSPNLLPVVLALGTQSLRAEVPVTGDWPALAVRAGVSPALQAALDSNRAQPPAVDAGLTAWAIGLAAALLGGLILNLMPCVFPVLAIKVLGFAQQGTRSTGEQRAQGLAYTAGVVLSFVALGGLMLALRASGEQLGWGFQLQSPAVVASLAVLFTLLALNLAGWLNIGNVLPSNLASLQLRHPLADAFLSGVLAVAIASPCTAPFMGASLGYAISLPAAQALGIFAALGLGLALPYLLTSWLPAVGRWLPRPGAWMEQLRRFMAFPMAATVVWLLWVLGHLSGVDGAASLLALLLALAMLLWSLQLTGRSRLVFASISIAACALLAGAIGPNILKLEETPVATSTTADGGWQAWAPARVQAELAAGKPVFVDFTAAWCITCQYNKKTTLANADVLADFVQRQVTLLRADWTRRDPAITQALGALGRSGVPVYVLYQQGRAPIVMSEILGVQELRAALNTL